MSGNSDPASLQTQLDRVVGLASRDLGRHAQSNAWSDSFHAFSKWAPLAPGLWLGRNLIGFMAGGGHGDGYFYCALPAGIILLLSGRPLFAAWSSAISRRRSLSAADRALRLEDRLQTADEFLAVENPTPFMEAALVDASEFAQRVTDFHLEAPRRTRAATFPEQMGLLMACVLLVAAIVSPESDLSDAPVAPEVALSEVSGHVTEVPSRADEPDATTQPAAKPDERKPKKANPSPAPATDSRKDAEDLREGTRMSRGLTRPGTPAGAVAASGQGNARGAPSDQSQDSKGSNKKKAKRKPKKKRPATPETETKKQDTKKETGTTAGRGAAGGSNKNPTPSQWSSKDQVTSEDEEDLEDDAEVDDEFDNSDSRGGLQPAIRDRRPPVNRDLGIGFGNQKNPDANGRGGPSEQKKSRGVASLVLGVPIPDHIKGKPNPGKTKITQERVEPATENAAKENAEKRRTRTSPMGTWSDIQLSPAMRRLVRDYFLNRQQTANGD